MPHRTTNEADRNVRESFRRLRRIRARVETDAPESFAKEPGNKKRRRRKAATRAAFPGAYAV